MKTDLSEMQARLLEFLVAYSDEHGQMPTQRRMANEFRLEYLGTIRGRLAALERKGWIRRTGKPRGIEIRRWA